MATGFEAAYRGALVLSSFQRVAPALAIPALLLCALPAAAETAESIGVISVGAPRAAVEKTLGQDTDKDPSLATSNKVLWELSDATTEPPTAMPAIANLCVEFDADAVRSSETWVDLNDKQTAALASLETIPSKSPWPTSRGLGLGAPLDEVLKLYGRPQSAPGYLPEDEEDPTPPDLDNGGADLRYKIAENLWLFVIVSDLDPREKSSNVRVVRMRLDRPLVR